MTADIRVPIPAPGEDLRWFFDESVENDQFGLALDFSVAEFDELARMTDIEVIDVDVSDAGVAVHYSVSWAAFHPCDDKTIQGDTVRIVRGRTERTHWLFEKAASPATRSTLDEL
jgi:hypothetical protein